MGLRFSEAMRGRETLQVGSWIANVLLVSSFVFAPGMGAIVPFILWILFVVVSVVVSAFYVVISRSRGRQMSAGVVLDFLVPPVFLGIVLLFMGVLRNAG